MSRIIGIDLGTTNSVVSILENGRPEVIQNSEGNKTTPSVVYFEEGGEVIVGELAKRQAIMAPERVIYSVKRFMGCRMEEAEARMNGIVYKVCEDDQGMACVEVGGKKLRPEIVSAETLGKMKETAEAFCGDQVHNAVITVPAHFNDSQRQATKIAAENAGLQVLRIVNEPTAAALAYGLTRNDGRQLIAVFDFGGGTFDISILEIDGDIFEVKSTGGDTFLGGDNINYALVEWINERVLDATGIDPVTDHRAIQRIAETAEKAKCELSTLVKTSISLPYIVSDDSGPKHFEIEITRDEFNVLVASILDRLREPCLTALSDAGLTPEKITGVLMVGGSTRIPAVRQLAKEIFDQDVDISLNPDEVVACGAAIQAGIMSGDLEEILLLDVTPLSLGIELDGDLFSPLVPRNSNVPTSVKKNFTTVVNNQTTVKIHVLQGERKMASQNRTLAHLKLTGIAPAPKEIPEIEVSFNIDANCILTVSAMDLTSGASNEIEVESSSLARGSDAERLAAEAEGQIEDDRIFMQKLTVRRRLREMETSLDEVRERKDEIRITEEQENQVREAFFKLDIALAQDSWDIIEEAERNAKAIFMEINSLVSLADAQSQAASLLDASQGGSAGSPGEIDISNS